MTKTEDSLKTLREKANLTQDDFALLLGVSKRTIAYWESGDKKPQPRLLRQAQEILNDHINKKNKIEKPALAGDKLNRERALIKVLLHEVARLKAKDEGITFAEALDKLKQSTSLVLDDLEL